MDNATVCYTGICGFDSHLLHTFLSIIERIEGCNLLPLDILFRI